MTSSSQRIINMVIAFLVAIAAWVFVVYNYDPMTLVRYTDVPVSFSGENELAARGLAVSKSSLENVAVTLSQKRVDGSSISAEDITVTADVSECVAGNNSVELSVSGPSGTKVSSVSASNAEIEVARIRSEIMDIKVIYAGEFGENEEPIAHDLSITMAEVSCSADMFDKISMVAAVLDREKVTDKDKSYTVYLEALDKEGNVIPHVVISPREVSLDAREGYTKTVNLYMNVKDDSKDDYERTYTAPDTVTIKGPKSVVNKISSVISTETDVSYMYVDEEIPIEYDLPEGVCIADESLGQTMKLEVKQKKTEE